MQRLRGVEELKPDGVCEVESNGKEHENLLRGESKTGEKDEPSIFASRKRSREAEVNVMEKHRRAKNGGKL